MHKQAMENGKKFFERYVKPGKIIVDVGAQDINGSLRELAPQPCKFIGVDCAPGKGVDIVSEDPYSIPLPDEYADAVISTSCFEHVEFFWELFVEMCRITKAGGYVYIDAPSSGPYHQHPFDCWRFYPDAGPALAKWACDAGEPVRMVETTTTETGEWNDWVTIFQKEKR